MMLKLRILPYKPFSKSAKVISRILGGLRIRQGGEYFPRRNHLVINWGTRHKPFWWKNAQHKLNDPEHVQRSSNKAIALQVLKAAGIPVPEFTFNKEEALRWGLEGAVIVGRKVLNGHGGIGCVIWSKNQPLHEFPDCPLYTKHIRHKREFRVHVFRGKVIDITEKLKARGFVNRNPWIRNHLNGYIFARKFTRALPEGLEELGRIVCETLRLDFGAVDIGYREKENKLYVFEVNSAPGIEGQTINKYIEAIQNETRILL